jgi:protein-tyrosine kinase
MNVAKSNGSDRFVMVNTHVLEKRLGWRSGPSRRGSDPEETESRQVRHAPVLQGRVQALPEHARRRYRRDDIDQTWADLPVIAPDLKALETGTLASLDRGTPAAVALDQLRTQLMRALKKNNWGRVGITSPTRECGKTFVAVGLAASFARLDYARVALVDMDLESPDIAEALDMDAPGPLQDFLAGGLSIEEHLVRVGDNLALALNSQPVIDPGEFVQDPDIVVSIKDMMARLAPDVVLFDLPPLLSSDVATAFLPYLDGVLLVADGTKTIARDIEECERILAGQTELLGVILNKSEDDTGHLTRRRRR